MTQNPGTDRAGVWLIGACGGVATTVVAGALALRRGLCGASGLTTEIEPFAHQAIASAPGSSESTLPMYSARRGGLTR